MHTSSWKYAEHVHTKIVRPTLNPHCPECIPYGIQWQQHFFCSSHPNFDTGCFIACSTNCSHQSSGCKAYPDIGGQWFEHIKRIIRDSTSHHADLFLPIHVGEVYHSLSFSRNCHAGYDQINILQSSSSSSSSLFSQRIQVKLHISITHWIHTGINGKGSRKSNAYLAAYLGRTKKYTHTQKNARYMKHKKLENIFTQTLLRTHNVYGNMNTYSMYHNHIS